MASIKFYLKNPKEEKSSIYFLLNYGSYKIVDGKKKYVPLKYYVSETINPTYWNNKIGRAKRDRRFKQFPEFNSRLQSIEDETLNVLRRLQNDEVEITSDRLKMELDSLFKPEKEANDINKLEFLDFFSYFLETSDFTHSTIKTHRQTLRDLKEYEVYKRVKLTFDKITIDFHANFIMYLKDKRSFAPNTIGMRIKVIKTVMRAAYERGMHDNRDFQKKAFVKPKEETTAIYLNESELERLISLDLSENTKLCQVRDWFIIAAYSGLRFSDFSRLTKENIQGDRITINTQKTGTKVVIPLHTVVIDILQQYDYNLPKVISNQKFNEYIKEVCKMAGIDDVVLIEETKGHLKVTKNNYKYNLVSAHTARRSFATNAFLAGVPTIQIMKLTGHRTEKIFMNYIKISEAENADKLMLHPFFNKKMGG